MEPPSKNGTGHDTNHSRAPPSAQSPLELGSVMSDKIGNMSFIDRAMESKRRSRDLNRRLRNAAPLLLISIVSPFAACTSSHPDNDVPAGDGGAGGHVTEVIDSRPTTTTKQDAAINNDVPDAMPKTEAIHISVGRGFARALTVSLGAKEALTDVPVLLRLPATFDYAHAEKGGRDVHVVDEAGHELPTDVDTWAPGGESLVWVRLPQVQIGQTVHATLVYGGALPVNRTQDSAWDPRSFISVWHLSGDAHDAGPAGLDGVKLLGKAAYANGGVGQGLTFPPKSSSALRLGQNLKTLAGVSAVTVSMLVYAGDLPAFGEGNPPLFTFGTDHRPSAPGYEQSGGHDIFGLALISRPDGAQLQFHARPNMGPTYFFAGFESFKFERRRWTHVALTLDLTTGTWITYRDGRRAEGPKTVDFGAKAYLDDLVSWQASIATDPEGCCGFFDGSLDEIRFEHVVRSDEWIRIQNEILVNQSLSQLGKEITVN
jgi:hypothetical protein